MLTPVDSVAVVMPPRRRGPFYEFACDTLTEFIRSDMTVAEVTGWPRDKGKARTKPDHERVGTALRDRARRAQMPVAVRVRGTHVYLERSDHDAQD